MAESAEDVRRIALGVIRGRLMDSQQLLDEYRSVLGRDPTIRHSQTAAHAAVNQSKNRYSNVLPYDHNRVLLRPCHCGTPAAAAAALIGRAVPRGGSSGPASDYINASHVVHEDAQCGFSVRYIASQGPLAGTEADFWRMCWSERVGAVVMLTNVVERGVSKCSPYFPENPGERRPQAGPATTTAGGTTGPAGAACVREVVAVGSTSLQGGDLTYTALRIYASDGAGGGGCRADGGGGSGPGGDVAPATREVAHLHYNAWPDHGTPADGAAIRTICDMVEPVRAAGEAIVVHCSAGIGRTGTFCAIDILRRRLAHLEACAAARPGSVRPDAVQTALDLPELVHSLRRQRCGMVQTYEQYAFCYQAVYEELLAGLGGGGGGGGGAGGRGGDGGTTPRSGRR